jgi:hypothetical protein
MPKTLEVPYIRRVRTVIVTSKEAMTVIALFLEDLLSAEEPISIGSSGKMHGANIVSTPAINDMIMSCNSTLA